MHPDHFNTPAFNVYVRLCIMFIPLTLYNGNYIQITSPTTMLRAMVMSARHCHYTKSSSDDDHTNAERPYGLLHGHLPLRIRIGRLDSPSSVGLKPFGQHTLKLLPFFFVRRCRRCYLAHTGSPFPYPVFPPYIPDAPEVEG